MAKLDLSWGQIGKMMLGGLMIVSLTACASANDDGEISDPFETTNRFVFKINDTLDENVAVPVAEGYRFVFPEPARVGIRNVLRNLKSPLNIAHQTLQADFDGAANDVGRALLNTTAGIGGLFDVAGYMGLKYEPEDFGQTMGKWGVAEGPYLVVPLLGPSNVRDSVGRLTDAYADPLRIYLANTDREYLNYTRMGVGLVSDREALLEVLEDLQNSSMDYYAVMRSSYHQYRKAQINDAEGSASSTNIPDYSDEEDTE